MCVNACLLPLLLQMLAFLADRLKCNIILKCSGALTRTMRSLNTQLCQGPRAFEKIAVGRLLLEPLGAGGTKHKTPLLMVIGVGEKKSDD